MSRHPAIRAALLLALAAPAGAAVLEPAAFQRYVEAFNAGDQELYAGHVPNRAAWEFLKDNIPLLDCPDEDIQSTYYFRWWTYRKHLKQTPAGFIVDEFLPPVGWAGKYNAISCAAGHHFYEGRWLRDNRFLDDYARFWFRGGGEPRRYSFWAADAIRARGLVTGEAALELDLLPDLVRNYEEWERTHRDPNGLYWQSDDRDGMEVSIGGSGYRATINSYQYGDARALARIAERAGKPDVAAAFRAKAAELKRLVQERLWDADASFFKVRPRGEGQPLAGVRELHGYTPWYFDLPDPPFAAAWQQLMDPQGFFAPYGPTTAEQRHPGFRISYAGHECQWNGPSWPYATAVTLTALANLLNGPPQEFIRAQDYVALLRIYAQSHRLRRDDGRVVPWIDENLNPTNGDWISRTRLKSWKNGTWDAGKGGEERGKDYNHSTFCDLVISGLVGLRPRADDVVEVHPLAPPEWPWFCLDRVAYHGRTLSILWDRDGTRYGRGKGLRVLADGVQIAGAPQLARVTGPLVSAPGSAAVPAAASGVPPDVQTATRDACATQTPHAWEKSGAHPVLGGKHGTCFDVAVLRESEAYRMWLSWRPKKALALVESRDGVLWSEPPRVVLGPRAETGWEDDINRPTVLKRAGVYHLWYTGQAGGRSAIGYATSADGVTWTRMSGKPVLAPEQPWERVAVMCPHVMWDEPTGCFRMWYSGGEQSEPNAIGYATSPDGLTWRKHDANPVFVPDQASAWERHKVAACQVERVGEWYVMFYIGFRDEAHAQIGLARSRDGITDWQRHPGNPIIRPGAGRWDADACYKPFAIFDGAQWLLWYNGRRGALEQIGLATHAGADLGFP